MNEELTKAIQGLEMVREDMLAALRKATAIESIMMLPMIEKLAILRRDLYSFATDCGH
jgi:hypothetical protein